MKSFILSLLTLVLTFSYSVAQPIMEVLDLGNNAILHNSFPPTTFNSTDFGSIPAGNGIAYTYIIKNTGSSPLTIGPLNITGTGASEYAVTSPPASTVNPGNSTTFDITFSPTISGTFDAQIEIQNGDANYQPSYNIPITGMAPSGGSADIDIFGNYSNFIPNGSTATSTTDSTDFGTVILGNSSIVHYIVANNGGSGLNISSVNIVGTGASEFYLTYFPAGTINPLLQDYIEITFTPASVGTKTATIQINSNDPLDGFYTFDITANVISGGGPDIAVTGMGINIPDGSTSTMPSNNTDFGSVPVGNTVTNQFNCANSGTLTLNISSSTISGPDAADFNFFPAPTPTISPASSSNYFIEFTPSSVGPKFATVTIQNNDSDEGTFTYNISGTGFVVSTDPDIIVLGGSNTIPNGSTTPNTFDQTDFDQVTVNTLATRTYTIRNVGTADLNLSAPEISISGPNSPNFSIQAAPATTITPGNTTTFTIGVMGASPSTLSATISINSNDPDDNPYVFDIQAKIVTLPTPDLIYVGSIVNYSPDPFPVVAFSNSPGNITYSIISGTNATIDPVTGILTPFGAGTIVIEATQDATPDFAGASATATVIILPVLTNIHVIPRGEVAGSPDFQVEVITDFDGTITYTMMGDNSVATVQPNGMVTPISPGSITVIAVGTGSGKYYDCMGQAVITVYGSILPPVAVNDTIEIELGDSFTLNLIENDTGKTGFIKKDFVDIDIENEGRQSKFYQPSVGNFTIDDEGNLSFAPFSTFLGTVNLGYFIYDNDGQKSNMGIVVVTVKVSNPELIPDLKANEVITANNDGLNDVLIIGYADQTKQNQLTIVDENYQVVYSATNYQMNWSGLDNSNNKLSAGTYFFTYEEDNGNRTLSGHVQIMWPND